jgi:hypothetical protein
MEAQDLRTELHRMIDQISDVDFLTALREIVQRTGQPIVGYTPKGGPVTKEQYIKDIGEAQQRARAGKYTSVEDLEKNSEKW